MLSKNIVLSAIVAGMSVLCAALPASAVTDTIFKYTTPKTGTLSVSTMAFGPDGNSTAANSWFNGWSGNTLTGNGCFNTGVTLPQGATITNFRAVYSKGVDAYLVSTARESGSSVYIASINEVEDNTNRIGVSVAVSPGVVVNNVVNQFGIGVCLDEGETFFGARIQYTYTNAGD